MKIANTALVVAVLASAAPAVAHPDHDAAPVANRSIAEKAQDAVLVQIARSKLDTRWSTAVPGKPEARVAAGATRWAVPFRQAKSSETLVVTLSESGDFLSAAVASR
jgi:hypothetical protein